VLTWLQTRLEYVFTIFAISVFSGAYINIPIMMRGGGLELGASNPFNTVSMVLILAVSGSLAFRYRTAVLPLILKGHLINAFVLLAAISTAWSIDWAVTLRRIGPLLACILLAYYMAARYPMEKTLDRLAIACLTMVIASVIVSLALPSIGRSTPSHPGAWNGVFSHKNGLGWVIILASLVYSWKFWRPGARKARYLLLLLFFCALSVLSQSMTSLVASIFGFFAFPFIRMLRAPGILRLWAGFIFGAGGLLAAAILVLFWTEILTGIGRDPTLTGRIPLWHLLFTFATEHFVLGYGYSSFWIEWNPDADFIWKVIQWDAPEAHNAYLDMLLQLGIFGLILSVAILIKVVRLSMRDFLTEPQPWTEFVLVNAMLFALTNMVETMLFRAGDVHCWLLPLTYFALVQVERVKKPAPKRAGLTFKPAQRQESSSW